jgi:hypothetical protein
MLHAPRGWFQPSLVHGECRFKLEMSVTGMFVIKVFRHSTLLYRVLRVEQETNLAPVKELINCYEYVLLVLVLILCLLQRNTLTVR